MKKIIFSAIAMIAFAGSSMANTIKIDESLNIESVYSGRPVNSIGSGAIGCLAGSEAVRETAQEMGLSEDQSDKLANASFNACMDTLKK